MIWDIKYLLLNNNLRANKLLKITNKNIISSLFVNENLFDFLMFPNPTTILFYCNLLFSLKTCGQTFYLRFRVTVDVGCSCGDRYIYKK